MEFPSVVTGMAWVWSLAKKLPRAGDVAKKERVVCIYSHKLWGIITLLSCCKNYENLRHSTRGDSLFIYLLPPLEEGGQSWESSVSTLDSWTVLERISFGNRFQKCLVLPFAMSWLASKADGLFGSMTRPFSEQRISPYFYEECSLHPHSRNMCSLNIIPSPTLKCILTTCDFGIWAQSLYLADIRL